MKIGVVGLGYVGLPLALAFARKFEGTVGFDINSRRVEELRDGEDSSEETPSEEIRGSSIFFTDNASDLRGCDFFVVGVPTPVDQNNTPELSMLSAASRTVGEVIAKGAIVVYESTVYPGVTEDFCGPIIEQVSGLKRGRDFYLGYSPERINPGDQEHRLETIVKVVSGENSEVLEKVARTYGAIVQAGVHRAPSIRVAEAAKVIENTQRDLNIALMNELAVIFDRMNICTRDVLEAAGTKWNFLKFFPGLVGGHCIGVDPYYLTCAAKQHGYYPQVILSGRRINDNMGRFIAQKTVKMLANAGCQIRGAKVGVFGLTFKENVKDLRNSRVPDIIGELKEFGCEVMVHDPMVSSKDAEHEYGLSLVEEIGPGVLDAAILAVAHKSYLDGGSKPIVESLRRGGIFVDVKSALNAQMFGDREIKFWAL